MKPTINAVWETLIKETKKAKEKDPHIVLHLEKEEEFKKRMNDLYDEIKEKYMKKEVDFLDRHKVAAVAVVAIIKCDLITYDIEIKNNEIFIGQEVIALNVALSMMLKMLNEKIKKSKMWWKKVNRYVMPIAMSCDTPYILILARNLYYSQRDFQLNVLDLADKFFLLETITFKKKRINPKFIAEY